MTTRIKTYAARWLAVTALAVTLVWQQALPAGEWTGIRAYVSDTRLAWSGESDCAPCNRFCADLRAYNRRLKALGGAGWRIGYSETGTDGRPNQICLLQALPDDLRPTFVAVANGIEGPTIEGYDASDPARTIDAILQLYPPGTRTVAPRLSPVESWPRFSSLSDEEPRRSGAPVRVVEIVRVTPAVPNTAVPARRTVRTTYDPHWTWPGDLKTHLARTHGYSRSYLDSLSLDQLEALHDRDHDSGRVTPFGVQRWRPLAGTAHVTTRETTRGWQVLGAPLVGTSTRSTVRNCPGGVCPY